MKSEREPPSHLRPETKKWWRQIADEFELQSQHYRLLTLAAEAWDRGEEARIAVRREGLFYSDKKGHRFPHPGIAVERDSAIRFARLVRELALDDAIEPPRPPRIGGR